MISDFTLMHIKTSEVSALALPTSEHGVAGSNPSGGEILPEPKRRFIAQSLSFSPFHRLEILLKGRKTLTHPSIHQHQNIYHWRKYYTKTSFNMDFKKISFLKKKIKFQLCNIALLILRNIINNHKTSSSRKTSNIFYILKF